MRQRFTLKWAEVMPELRTGGHPDMRTARFGSPKRASGFIPLDGNDGVGAGGRWRRGLGAIVLAAFCGAAFGGVVPGGADMFWISSVSPRTRDLPPAAPGRTADDSGLGQDETDSAYSPLKRFWFRLGDQVASARYVREARSFVVERLDAPGARAPVSVDDSRGVASVTLELQEKGFSNLYARRSFVQNGTFWLQLAKGEMIRGNFRDSSVPDEQARAIRDPIQPLEIVREHPEKELLFPRHVSGDTLKFTILAQGKPIEGIPVTMLTQQGWLKSVMSDANGQVSFTLIRDNFPAWYDLRRRIRETFVVVADRGWAENGAADGEKYAMVRHQATLSGRYSLSPRDYTSYAYGLGITIFVVTFSGLAIYLYRRRRIRPFREIRFDEGN